MLKEMNYVSTHGAIQNDSIIEMARILHLKTRTTDDAFYTIKVFADIANYNLDVDPLDTFEYPMDDPSVFTEAACFAELVLKPEWSTAVDYVP